MRNLSGALLFLMAAPAHTQQPVPDPAYFSTKLYPIFESAQCRLCHNDNGVASNTRLRFPREAANAEEIRQFSLGLEALVDRQQPDQSLLLRKPTNRIAHTGGERIRQGTEDESVLRNWVVYLATPQRKRIPRRTQISSFFQSLSGRPAPDAQPVQQHRARPARGPDAARRPVSQGGFRSRLHQPGGRPEHLTAARRSLQSGRRKTGAERLSRRRRAG